MPTKAGHANGPEPKSFRKWCLAVGRKGCTRFRIFTDDGQPPRMVAYKNAASTARLIVKLRPIKAEALDKDDALLRMWEFPEDRDAGDASDGIPGYVKEEGDTEDERILKTFAHLLADAHKTASKHLSDVVSVHAALASEERKALLATRMLNDKLMSALARKTARIRVAELGEDGEPGGEEAAEPDTFLQDLFAPLIKRYVSQQAAEQSGDAEKSKNGAS